MTVLNTTNKAGPFVGNASATAFPFTLKVFDADDLTILKIHTDDTEEVLVKDTDYTVVLNDDQNVSPGGTVTYPISGTPLAATEYLSFYNEPDATQESDITNLGGFYPDVVENMADRNAMSAQHNRETIDRSLKFSQGASAAQIASTKIPATAREKYLRISDAGLLELADISASTTILSQSIIAALLNPPTPTEVGAGAPTILHWLAYDLRRYDAASDASAALTAALAAVPEGGMIYGHGEDTYDFGAVGIDEIRYVISKRITIDFFGATVKVQGNDTSGNTGSALFQFLDTRANLRNVVFDDENFDLTTSAYRGVHLAVITNGSADSLNHVIDNVHIVRGQSICVLTHANGVSATPAEVAATRASNIWIRGTADMAYYGIVAVNNGDRIYADIHVEAFNRLIFLHGVSGCRIKAHGGEGANATSSPIYLWRNHRDTMDNHLDVILDSMAGPVRISSDTTAGAGAKVNGNRLKLHVRAFDAGYPEASNPAIVIGETDGAGWSASSDMEVDQLHIDFTCDVPVTRPIEILTASPNYGQIETPSLKPILASEIEGFTRKDGAHYSTGVLTKTLESSGITAVSLTNPVRVTDPSHGHDDGAVIGITGIVGTTQLNDRIFTISVVDADNYDLVGEDGTAHGAWVSDGASHQAVGIDIDRLTSHLVNDLRSFAADIVERSNTSGTTTAHEQWIVQLTVSSGGIITIRGQDRSVLAKVGAHTPLGQFIASETDSKLYAIMTGDVTTTGSLALTLRQAE